VTPPRSSQVWRHDGMVVRYIDVETLKHETPMLAVGVFEGTETPSGWLEIIDRALGGAILRVLSSGDFRGKSREELVLYGPENIGLKRLLLLGLGQPDKLDSESVRRTAGLAVRVAERMRLESLSISLDAFSNIDATSIAQAAAEGAVLSGWKFRELKTDISTGTSDVTTVDILGLNNATGLSRAVETGAKIADAANFARALQSRPGNVATPAHLAEEAEKMAVQVGLDVTVFDERRMLDEGMHAILAVSRGSQEEARLIVMKHNGGEDGEPPLVLVGKGLTFDAGGISLKPPKGMEDMKFDMSGGAAVMGAMKAIAELGVPANVVGIVPASENLPSGNALKPGDVINTLAGKTVEVINTDAEGRLILADALCYGAQLNPAAMVDCATLTGAVVIALGHQAAAVLGNQDDLIDQLVSAGESSGERCWPLPMWDCYRKQLDSETADLSNVGGRPAGSITAAMFLSEFVGDTPWAHLDIAGTAYGDGKLPYQRKGAYGFPTRMLIDWVRSRAG